MNLNDINTFLNLAESIINGKKTDESVFYELSEVNPDSVFRLMAGADLLREHYYGRRVHLCTILNGKSGRCSEDCKFCAQSSFSETDSPVYPLLPKEDLQKGIVYAEEHNINRYSIVASGKKLTERDLDTIAEAFREKASGKTGFCASLGTLNKREMQKLKDSGVTRYHHNLETAPSFYDKICTTHKIEERIECVKSAREAGLSVCSGGLFGLGETDAQVVELGLLLKKLDVDSVPVNFLSPIKGTPLENADFLSPLRCLKIIALLRFILPNKDIYICGGRLFNLRELHPLVFHAGASGIMTGNYLTTPGRKPEEDMETLSQLDFIRR